MQWRSVAILLAAAAPQLGAQDTRLQRVRDEVNRLAQVETAPAAPPAAAAAAPSAPQPDHDVAFNELCSNLFLTPFLVPHHVVGDDWQNHAGFPRYPYEGDHSGYLFAPQAVEVPKDAGWAGWRLSLENGNDLRSLNRLNGRLQLDSAWRWGVVTDWNHYSENGPGGADASTVGTADLTYRFAQHPRFQSYAGVGVRLMADSTTTSGGINIMYGVDAFPAKPWVLSWYIDGGTLGDAGVVHTRVTLGAAWRGCELFAGYDYLRIGRVDLQGPLVGVRFWR